MLANNSQRRQQPPQPNLNSHSGPGQNATPESNVNPPGSNPRLIKGLDRFTKQHPQQKTEQGPRQHRHSHPMHVQHQYQQQHLSQKHMAYPPMERGAKRGRDSANADSVSDNLNQPWRQAEPPRRPHKVPRSQPPQFLQESPLHAAGSGQEPHNVPPPPFDDLDLDMEDEVAGEDVDGAGVDEVVAAEGASTDQESVNEDRDNGSDEEAKARGNEEAEAEDEEEREQEEDDDDDEQEQEQEQGSHVEGQEEDSLGAYQDKDMEGGIGVMYSVEVTGQTYAAGMGIPPQHVPMSIHAYYPGNANQSIQAAGLQDTTDSGSLSQTSGAGGEGHQEQEQEGDFGPVQPEAEAGVRGEDEDEDEDDMAVALKADADDSFGTLGESQGGDDENGAHSGLLKLWPIEKVKVPKSLEEVDAIVEAFRAKVAASLGRAQSALREFPKATAHAENVLAERRALIEKREEELTKYMGRIKKGISVMKFD
ncbi:hypothetical protein M427DRAFT_26827 [Gonapodya prolifera JEL478]|uniref:Uncharacterized protein n=1 Tax=Gonapodya prolifera (strain JEL478) TaxID=1344416 RepID=A0A139AZS6_GONPJ|nr:hypothetical protein M427DRAFT_26827 [Gonapodya prolifera JEL478]|eukprot:KXS22200.1 hypothetical protein M427DRAFT_26827 [Gonapodya prolifera JEL478]